MNIDDWKAVAERHAGTRLRWTDRKCPWNGSTSWADGPEWTYSIIMGLDPPAVRYHGGNTIPLEEPCQNTTTCSTTTSPETAPTVGDTDTALAVTEMDTDLALVPSAMSRHIPNQSHVPLAEAMEIAPPATELETISHPKTRSRPIASRNQAMRQATFL